MQVSLLNQEVIIEKIQSVVESRLRSSNETQTFQEQVLLVVTKKWSYFYFFPWKTKKSCIGQGKSIICKVTDKLTKMWRLKLKNKEYLFIIFEKFLIKSQGMWINVGTIIGWILFWRVEKREGEWSVDKGAEREVFFLAWYRKWEGWTTDLGQQILYIPCCMNGKREEEELLIYPLV